MGGNGTPLLKGEYKISCALGPRAKQRLHRNLGQTWLQVLENLLGKWSHWLTLGEGHWRQSSREYSPAGAFLWRWPFWKNLAPPISTEKHQAKQQSRWDHSPTPQLTGCLKTPPDTQPPLIPSRDKAPPTKGIRISSTYQWAGISPSHQEAYSKPCTNFSHKVGRHQK